MQKTTGADAMWVLKKPHWALQDLLGKHKNRVLVVLGAG
jgi:hypothetical protein